MAVQNTIKRLVTQCIQITCDMSTVSLLENREQRCIKAINNNHKRSLGFSAQSTMTATSGWWVIQRKAEITHVNFRILPDVDSDVCGLRSILFTCTPPVGSNLNCCAHALGFDKRLSCRHAQHLLRLNIIQRFNL